MSPAQIQGSILLKHRSFREVQIARNRAHCQSLPGQNGRICATWSPMSRKLTATSSVAVMIDSTWARSLYKRGNRLATMIDIGCPSHSSRSLPPLYATPPRQLCCVASPPTPASTPPRCRRQAHSRASTCDDPRHSYVASFSCGRRLSVAPLDLHVKIILMCIGPLCATSHAPPLRSP
jgi:hypothetical protein